MKSVLKDSWQPCVIVNWYGMHDVEGWRTSVRLLNDYCKVCTTKTRRERGGWMLTLNFVRLMNQTMMTVMVMTMKVAAMIIR